MSECKHGFTDGPACPVCHKKPSTTAPERASSEMCNIEGCSHDALGEGCCVIQEDTRSQEAYLTIVRIQRYKGGFDEDLVDCEDEYSFEIGQRTFPEVLELVDCIKLYAKCMTLKWEAKR